MGDASDALLVLYAAVAIKSPTAPPCMLAEHATACGNFRKVAKSLVDKLPHVNDRRTFTLQQYAFNVLVKDRFVFLAIVENALKCPKTMPFSFLDSVAAALFDSMKTSKMMEKELHIQVQRYARDPTLHSLDVLKSELLDTTNVLGENIINMLSRSERLDVVVCKSEELATEAKRFKQRAAKLRNTLSYRAFVFKVFCITLAVALILLVCAIIGECGWEYLTHPNPSQSIAYCPAFAGYYDRLNATETEAILAIERHYRGHF